MQIFLEIIFWAGAFLVFYTYAGYGMVLYLAVKIKEKAKGRTCEPPLPDDAPEVTLLIAAYNEEAIVDEKMANCRALDYPAGKLRITWVTDGSDDGTVDALSRYPDATVLHSPQRRGKTEAINRAMTFVTTPYVVFTDANTMLNTAAITEIIRPFGHPDVGCVSGEKRIVQKKEQSAEYTEGVYWKYESKLKELDYRLYSAVGAAGELFAIRTELFRPMPQDTLLDDFTLSMEIASHGYRIAYCKDSFAVEEASAGMDQEEKRKVRISAGGLQAVWRLRGMLNVFRYGVLGWQYISHRVLRWTITPVALFLLLPVNIALSAAGAGAIYDMTLVLQCLFYAFALCGYAMARRKVRSRIFFIPYYFLFMNVNVIKGIPYLIRRKSADGIWEKARRA